MKWLFRGIRNIFFFILIIPTGIALFNNTNGFYPYEFLDNVMYTIYVSSILGFIITYGASELFTEPEYEHHSFTTSQYRNVNGITPYWENVRHEISNKLDLTKEELKSNEYIRDFFSISILPIGLYIFLIFIFKNKDAASDNHWLEIAWGYFLIYFIIPFIICLVFSAILFFVINQKNRDQVWEKIKKWIAIMDKIFWGNIICSILWSWLVKLEFYKIFGF